MGYQFIHIECYARTGSKQRLKDKHGHVKESRKWSADDIAAEAERDPGACDHVLQPSPPLVLYGVSARETAEQAKQWAASAKDAKGRALRKDGLCLLAGVISLPVERIHDWESFKRDAVKYLQRKYGSRLRSVIEHTDEEHPHLHFYVVPEPGERFDQIHDGRNAADQLKASPKSAQNKAYKEAMRSFQDDFSNAVALRHGLARLGPARRRLTRSEWQSEKHQAQLISRAWKHFENESLAATEAGLLAYLTPEERASLVERRSKQKASIELEKRALEKAPKVEESGEDRLIQKMLKDDPVFAKIYALQNPKKGSDFSPDR